MEDYPGGISEEENSHFKFPFRLISDYWRAVCLPQGAVILIGDCESRLSEGELESIVRINKEGAKMRHGIPNGNNLS